MQIFTFALIASSLLASAMAVPADAERVEAFIQALIEEEGAVNITVLK